MKQDLFFQPDDAAFDPYWQFAPEFHFRPRVYKSDFFRLNGYWLIDVLFPRTSELMQQWDNELAWALRLSYGQKAMSYWATLDGQVSNGGFVQLYYNDYGRYLPSLLKGLAYIGEKEAAAMFRKAHALYLRDKDIMDEGMQGDLFGSDLYEEMDELDALSFEYYKISPKVYGVLDAYVRSHPNEFCVDEEGREIDPLLTGDFHCHYPDGTIRDSFSIDGGHLVGHFKHYYPNGQLMEDLLYDAGTFTGEKETYYETGMLKCRTTPVGQKDWIRREWFFDDGTPEKIEHRTRDITNLPRQFIYYPSLYEEGVLIGEYKEWYRNGQLWRSGTYLGNYINTGIYLTYYENGLLEREIHYNEEGEEVSRFYNPWPTNEELIRLCLTKEETEDIKKAARQLLTNEREGYPFREQLLSQIEAMAIEKLTVKEKRRLVLVIKYTQMHKGTRVRFFDEEDYKKLNQDAAFFEAIADRANRMLDRLKKR